ncbi:amidohydrolase family protein [Thermodesulfobacteriota bacterium]
MVVDFHTHIFPKDIRENRDKYFPSESAFKLLYSSDKSRLVGARGIVDAMDEQGVDVSVVFGFPWQNAETFKKHNDYIIESVEKYPGRLVGLGCFDPFNAAAGTEALRCIEGGLSGIGELAFYHSGIDEACIEKLIPVMDICLDRGLPVLIHTNEPVGHVYPGKSPNTLKEIYNLVKRFPENKIVLAHWGGGILFYNLLKREVKETFENVYFDTAASPFLYDAEIYLLAKQTIGTNKILFGSDFPLLKPERYFKELDTIGMPKKDIERICGLNAARLLKLA